MIRKVLKATLLLLLAAVVVGGGAIAWHLRERRAVVYTDAQTINEPADTALLRDILWQPPTRLPDSVNSTDNDFEPGARPDGMVLYFARGRPGDNADIYVSTRLPDGWSEAEPVAALNTAADELGPEPTEDGRSVYFYSNRAGGLGGYDLWVAHRNDRSEWDEPINLGSSINSRHNEYAPALATDGLQLFFASNRPRPTFDEEGVENTGDVAEADYDVYAASFTDQGFARAHPLDAVNTPFNEGSPALSPAGDFVYFLSDRPGGFGGYDIYRSRWIRGEYQAPTNLGAVINSAAHELDPGLSINGFGLHFSSDRAVEGEEDNYDLYYSVSREVLAEVNTHRASIDWAAIWDALWPEALWALLALLAAALLIALLNDAKFRVTSLLTKCLMGSTLAHLVLLLLLTFWNVTASVTDVLRDGSSVRVVLTSPSIGADIAQQIRGALTDVPMEPVEPTLPERAAPLTAAQTETALAALEVNGETPLPDEAFAHATPTRESTPAPGAAVPAETAPPLPEFTGQMTAPSETVVTDAAEASSSQMPDRLAQRERTEHPATPSRPAHDASFDVAPDAPQTSADETLARVTEREAPPRSDTAPAPRVPPGPQAMTAVQSLDPLPESRLAPAAERTAAAPAAANQPPRRSEQVSSASDEAPTQTVAMAPAPRAAQPDDVPSARTNAREAATPAVDIDLDRAIGRPPQPADRVQIAAPRDSGTPASAAEEATAELPGATYESGAIRVLAATGAQDERTALPVVAPTSTAIGGDEETIVAHVPEWAPRHVDGPVEWRTPGEVQSSADLSPSDLAVAELDAAPNPQVDEAPSQPSMLARQSTRAAHDSPAFATRSGASGIRSIAPSDGSSNSRETTLAAAPAEAGSAVRTPRWSAPEVKIETARIDPGPFAAPILETAPTGTGQARTPAPAMAARPNQRTPRPTGVVDVRTSLQHVPPTSTAADVPTTLAESPTKPATATNRHATRLGAVDPAAPDFQPTVQDLLLADLEVGPPLQPRDLPKRPGTPSGPEGAQALQRAALIDIGKQERGSIDETLITVATPPETVVTDAPMRSTTGAPDPNRSKDVASAPMLPLQKQDVIRIEQPEMALRLPTEDMAPPSPYLQRKPEVRKEIVERMGGSEETERAVAAALQWLARHQSPDGRWDSDGFDRRCGECDGAASRNSDNAITALAVLCFLASDHTHDKPGPYQENVRRGLQWLIQRQKANGDLRSGETMYSHGIATIALSEAYGMSKDEVLRHPVALAVRFISRARDLRVGGWRYDPGQVGDTSVMGWQIMALVSAQRAGIRVPADVLDVGNDWLDLVMHPGKAGQYAYQVDQPINPAMTAEGMFCRQLLGHGRNETMMQNSADYLLENMPSWPETLNTYYWYYATLAMYQHQGEGWRTWNEAITQELLGHQRTDGLAAGSWDPDGQWAHLGGRIYQTAICTLTLEVYYRYLPLYAIEAP